jgi:hypothetical protein
MIPQSDRSQRVARTGKGNVPPPPSPGRRAGIPNRTTRILREAILLAAEQVGEDKHGHDGLVGYLRKIAVEEPRAFCQLLQRVLPLQVNARVAVEDVLRDRYESYADAARAMRELGVAPQRLLPRAEDEKVADLKPND